MFIFSAQLIARPGQQQPAMTQIVEARQIIEDVTGRPTSAWSAVVGAQLGSFAISTRVESLAELMEGQAKLGASVEYAGLAAASAEIWSAPAETQYARVIGSTNYEFSDALISMTTTTIEGSFSSAIAFGNEVLEHVSASLGNGGLLMLSEAPDIGRLTWVFGNESPEAAAEADAKLQGDADYLALYDRASDLFVPGSTHRTMALRLG